MATTASNKQEGAPSSSTSPTSMECCMCGDCGLSHELFRCKVCQFRSQHRYCSNLYPKAESYRVCNWCLIQNNHETIKENSSNSSSPNKSYTKKEEEEEDHAISKSKRNGNRVGENILLKGSLVKLQVNGGSSPIKKQVVKLSPEERSPSTVARRRLIRSGSMEKRLIRRTKSSSELSNGGITKQVFRNKVRRYKLLDEVST